MANITESNTWESVRQWEITDEALGGTNGVMNTPLKSLVNRTAYLKNLAENIIAGVTGIVGKLLNGSTCENTYTAQQNDTKVATTAFVQSTVGKLAGRRNRILNGDMKIAQRGTTFYFATDDEIFTLDRWIVQVAGRLLECGQSPDVHRSDIPDLPYCFRFKLGASAGGVMILKQRIESVWTFAGGKCVVTFAIGAPISFDVRVRLLQFLNHSQIESNIFHADCSEVITINSGYGVYSVVFDIPDIADVVQSSFDDSNCLQLTLEFTDAREADFWITKVQVEAGSVPTDFEFRDDMNECLRYYEKSEIFERHDDARVAAEGIGDAKWYYRESFFPKRIVPTITKENITYEGLNTVSDIDNIKKNSCSLAIQPTDQSAGTYMKRQITFDMLINAEIE